MAIITAGTILKIEPEATCMIYAPAHYNYKTRKYVML